MRSSNDAARRAAGSWMALLVVIWLAMVTAGTPAFAAQPDYPSEAEVLRAVKVVKADPNLATERIRRVPSFFDDEPSEPETRKIGWLRNLFGWVGETGRVLLWVLGAILGTMLLVLLVRIWGTVDLRRAAVVAAAAPTHVRELDVRPESLPAQIGPAGLQLWEQGEQRAALALLYRGLVSRLIHVHGVPIRHSTTEAGCIELAHQHLAAAPAGYVVQLVRCWQRFVYGGVLPDDMEVRTLCGSFDATLAPDSLRKAAA